MQAVKEEWEIIGSWKGNKKKSGVPVYRKTYKVLETLYAGKTRRPIRFLKPYRSYLPDQFVVFFGVIVKDPSLLLAGSVIWSIPGYGLSAFIFLPLKLILYV